MKLQFKQMLTFCNDWKKMNNVQIENAGLDWLKEKLQLEGWEVNRVHKKGYDLIITNAWTSPISVDI